MHRRFADAEGRELSAQLRGAGIALDLGAVRVHVRSPLALLAERIAQVYAEFPLLLPGEFCDIHIQVVPGSSLRRWLRPQARFRVDGVEPFEPFPRDHALPLMEWGANFSIAQRLNQHLLLHAGVVAAGDRAVILAATPGSGKSTLTAALALSGFRLFSDEFGVVRRHDLQLLPLLKPVALKNESIDVIRRFVAHGRGAPIGPIHPRTRKGSVAHLAPDRASVDARKRPAIPTIVVFPSYQPDAPCSLRPEEPLRAFQRLAFNSFNYSLLGPDGFRAVAALLDRCPAYALSYSRLDEAVDAIGKLLDGT